MILTSDTLMLKPIWRSLSLTFVSTTFFSYPKILLNFSIITQIKPTGIYNQKFLSANSENTK